jgi:hypothetical protein
VDFDKPLYAFLYKETVLASIKYFVLRCKIKT